jgi:SAM-dependent methyltransferase
MRLSKNSPPLEGSYRHFKCRQCDATFLSEMPPPEHLAFYYNSPEYHHKLAGEDAPSPEARLRRFRAIQFRLSRPLPRGPAGRHLDYGCGPCHYLDYSRQRGWEGIGIEYSDESARTGRTKGHDVRVVDDLASLPDESFDYISSVHSLEHVERPTETLAALAAKLKPGGVLFVEVPYLGHEFRIFGKHYSMMQAPLHAVFFDDSTIRYMGNRAGLRLLSAKNLLVAPVLYAWSLLNAADAFFGFGIPMHQKVRLSTLAAPLTIVPAAVTSFAGAKGTIRQFYFTKDATPPRGTSAPS